MHHVSIHSKAAWILACTLLASSSARETAAQTRSYNPLREVHPAAHAETAGSRTTATRAAWQQSGQLPPVNNSPAWRNVRQPGAPSPTPAPTLPDPEDSPSAESLTAPPQLAPAGAMPGEHIEWHEGSPWPGGEAACGPACADCAPDCGGCDACCAPGCGGCGQCDDGFSCLDLFWPRYLAVPGGVQGFKGPVDRGQNGNFGFHYGLNFGGHIKPQCGIGYQVGANFVHSNLSGSSVAVNTTDERTQYFITAGIFHRVVCGTGWQGGVVFDSLHDDYYVNMDLSQIRGELSFLGPMLHELGFWFAASTRDDTATINGFEEQWEPTDLYAFFYRRNLPSGAYGRVWGGFTGRSDGLVGGEFGVPLSACWGLQSQFNYLIPEEGDASFGSEESWALGMSLVWYPGCKAHFTGVARPLFNVADNATFMVDRLNQ